MSHLFHVDLVVVTVRADPLDPNDALLEMTATTSRSSFPLMLNTIRSAETMLAVA